MARRRQIFNEEEMEAAQTLLQLRQENRTAVPPTLRKTPQSKAQQATGSEASDNTNNTVPPQPPQPPPPIHLSHPTTANTPRPSHPCTYPACPKTYLTTTGLRKHINSAHTQKLLFGCPVENCGFQQKPAKETVLRHLRGKHRMTDLPVWRKGADKDEVVREQLRGFREHMGREADVSFFTGGEEGEGDGGDEDDVAGGEGDGGGNSGQLEDRDSQTAADEHRLPHPSQDDPTNTQGAGFVSFGHTRELHRDLQLYAISLRYRQIKFDWGGLLQRLRVDLPEYKLLSDYVDNTSLMESHEPDWVGAKIGGFITTWLADFPLVDHSLPARLVLEMKKLEEE